MSMTSVLGADGDGGCEAIAGQVNREEENKHTRAHIYNRMPCLQHNFWPHMEYIDLNCMWHSILWTTPQNISLQITQCEQTLNCLLLLA